MPATVYLCDEATALRGEAQRRALATLPAERRARAERCVHEDDRARVIIAWLLLAYGLRTAYELDAVPPLAYGERGKPYFERATEDAALPHFNLSHSGPFAACALAPTEVGLDVQETMGVERHVSSAFVRRTCNISEIAWLKKAGPLGSPEHTQAFCALWTRKESVMKLTGRGLADALPRLLDLHDHDVATSTISLEGSAAREGDPAGQHAGFLSLSLWRKDVSETDESDLACPESPTAPRNPGEGPTPGAPGDRSGVTSPGTPATFRLIRVSLDELLAGW